VATRFNSRTEELGSATHVIFPIDAPPVDTESVRATTAEHETAVLLANDRKALFTAEVSERTTARVGKPLRLAVDASRFQFFDRTTGARLHR